MTRGSSPPKCAGAIITAGIGAGAIIATGGGIVDGVIIATGDGIVIAGTAIGEADGLSSEQARVAGLFFVRAAGIRC